ncbi:Serine/threonine-protein kinase pim-2 [Hypsizygus marmoreus]|uniref:Serine/threonine-protein kinase pim-2 n=1 Tax=Hypsizygus marmoreus TaxID=39966 RepID=A0A369J496_HYPMA|nr:Serine/threonine-protein kinase pim-2 [Hypsizygus marmoreus]
MRTHETRHHSFVQHAMTPELMDSPLSPSDPNYSSPIGSLSPAESDTLRTPFFDEYQPRTRETTHTHSYNLGGKRKRFASDNCSPRLPQLFQQSPTPHARENSIPFPEISPADYESPMGLDDFEASLSGLNHLEDAQDDPAPILVLCNPSNLDAHPLKTGQIKLSLHVPLNLDATKHSPHFPSGHKLNPHFVRHYHLEDELGSGGYGFVMTARHRTEGHEVAVKFIVKSKVPDYAWMEDETIGRLPTEVMLLSFIDHENIVKCLDLFEDSLYFYLIQELHGTPWHRYKARPSPPGKSIPASLSSASIATSTPTLSPSVSISSRSSSNQGSLPASPSTPPIAVEAQPITHATTPLKPNVDIPTPERIARPDFQRRPSHDLFECIEQSEHKRLSERQARYVFAQVVDAVHYLDSQGVAHRDIKDENLVINKDLKVKLIDFGSAAVVDPNEPRPYYTLFYGTTAYASSEILQKKKYQAAPAEVWTLGVLLSYLLTGASPFPTVKDAINGRIVLADILGARLSRTAMSLMRRCLDPNPETRATIAEVKAHRWLTS